MILIITKMLKDIVDFIISVSILLNSILTPEITYFY